MNFIKSFTVAFKKEWNYRQDTKMLVKAIHDGKRISTLADGSYVIIINN